MKFEHLSKQLCIVVTIILLLCWCLYYPITVFLPAVPSVAQKGKISNIHNIVDNDFNNSLCTGNEELVRIDNQLYYNYARDYIWNYGTYRLSEKGCNRIIWHGVRLLADDYELNPIRVFMNQLVLFSPGEETKSYLDNEFVETDIPAESFNFQAVNDAIYFTRHSVGDFRLYVFKDGKKSLVIDKEVSGFYCYENVIYYVTQNDTGSNLELRTYDINEKKDELFSYLESGFFKFLIEDDCIYVKRGQTVGRIDLKKGTDKATEQNIFSDNKVENINAWNKNVYICTEKGLYQYNTKSRITTRITDSSVKSCYIVDDYWVYFVSEKSSLWRVPQAGGTAEKVFG